MPRFSRAVVAVLVLVGLVVAAVPLHADEGHCARPIVAVQAPVHAHGHVLVAPAGGTLLPEGGCPACPARSCSAMQGCSAAPQASAEVVIARAAPMPGRRASLSQTDVVPASVTFAPPTPPPLVAFSPA